jgi:hypothetical protein
MSGGQSPPAQKTPSDKTRLLLLFIRRVRRIFQAVEAARGGHEAFYPYSALNDNKELEAKRISCGWTSEKNPM